MEKTGSTGYPEKVRILFNICSNKDDTTKLQIKINRTE
jgi:hypothetical protein